MPTEPTYKVASAAYSDMSNIVKDITVSNIVLDSTTSGENETEWINKNWGVYYGFYSSIPEVKTALDYKAIWTCGKKWDSPDAKTRVILNHITGYGKETFQSILQNLVITKAVAGDAFAEIIRDPKTETLLNLKVLDPGSIKIICGADGIIKRYEQIKGSKTIKFETEEIFHLTNRRTGDSIHGVSDLEALKAIIQSSAEAFEINKDVIKKYSRPMMKFILDTDDVGLISQLQVKFDTAVNKGENIYIPKGTVEQELISVPPNATLNILPWLEFLKNKYYQVIGIPQVIMGGSGDFTESSAKISYLSFQQNCEACQLEIENAVLNQLGLNIELEFPASLQNEMISDNAKDGREQQTGFQPSDTAVTMGES